MYKLFGRLADRYDWHTPPDHYQHDHAFVLDQFGKSRRILDIGCGTGVFLERAIASGLDAYGIDSSPEMVTLSAARVGAHRVRVERMQDLQESNAYAGIVSLSWTFNYVHSFSEARDVLARIYEALRPQGQLILQLAHAPNARGHLGEDRERGPDGLEADIVFLYRFTQLPDDRSVLKAQYVYGCKSKAELFFEEHILAAANAHEVAALAAKVGFRDLDLLESWRGEPMDTSVNVLLIARRP
ncbi:MAG: class I SAM-dependent methyltransferase [Rhodobacteraceae bacterium]|nr:class I SAM-dependent methyltransferase [Paracoccaceae bacterium]